MLGLLRGEPCPDKRPPDTTSCNATDGDEHCGGNPVEEVRNLMALGVKTYVVAFAQGANVSPQTLNAMAVEGSAPTDPNKILVYFNGNVTLVYGCSGAVIGNS